MEAGGLLCREGTKAHQSVSKACAVMTLSPSLATHQLWYQHTVPQVEPEVRGQRGPVAATPHLPYPELKLCQESSLLLAVDILFCVTSRKGERPLDILALGPLV